MTDRANHLAATINGPELEAAGVDSATADRLVAAVEQLKAQAAAYHARAAGIKATDVANKKLLHIVKRMDHSWTALAADGSVWYPHQQVLKDTKAINAALAALAASDGTAASNALMGVALTGLFAGYSDAAYARILELHQPWSPNVTWNEDWDADAHGSHPEREAGAKLIAQGDLAGAASALAPMQASEQRLLNERVVEMCDSLDWISAHIATVK